MHSFKKFILAFSLLCWWGPGAAQQNIFTHLTSYEKRGDKMFYYFSYMAALESYQSALKEASEKDHLKLKIAECYRMLNNPAESEKWYVQAITNTTLIKPEHKLHYAQALISNGEYDEAKKWLNAYQADVATDSRSLRKIEALNNLETLLRDSLTCSVQALNINARESDFSPALYGEGIVFVSARPQKKLMKTNFSWNQTQFLDLYYSQESENGLNNQPTLFHKNVNTSLHEGPTVFYANDTKMIFTRNNLLNGKKGESRDGVVKLKLYSSEKEGDEWANPKPLRFNSNEYSVGDPAITSDGKILYFASDMPGGLGGTDIYKSEWEGNDWGKPVNLGEEVNTEGNEMFPFLHQNNQLYFASNGHGGLGGLDIFTTPLNDLKPLNLGAPINSSVDDFGLIAHADGYSGYFSSNRKGNAGDDDIYHFAYVRKQIELIAYDAQTGALLSACQVQLMEGNRLVSASTTGHKGSAQIGINPAHNHTTLVQHDGYMPSKGLLESVLLQRPDFNQIRIPMQRMPEEGELEDSPKDSLITVLNFNEKGEGSPVEELLDGNDIGKGKTAVITLYQILNISGKLQEVAVWNNSPYILDESGKSLMNQSGNSLLNFSESLPAQLEPRKAIISAELEKRGADVSFIEIKNIYYDYKMDIIRNDASADLDKLLHLLLAFPELKVFLSSHTDSRGSTVYNEDLANRRAMAARDYLINEGAPDNQIEQSGFGEKQLVNDCGDGKLCDEDNHQLNRRTEIQVKFKTGKTINEK